VALPVEEAELPSLSVLVGTVSLNDLLPDRSISVAESHDPGTEPEQDLGRVWRAVGLVGCTSNVQCWAPIGLNAQGDAQREESAGVGDLIPQAIATNNVLEAVEPAAERAVTGHRTGLDRLMAPAIATQLATGMPQVLATSSSRTTSTCASQLCTGRRPRVTVEDWGGGLGEVLGSGRSRRAVPSQRDFQPQPRLPMRVEPDLSAWGGGLEEVLSLCPPRLSRRLSREAPGASTETAALEPMELVGGSGSSRFAPGTNSTNAGGIRPRASTSDWGGDLADVLGSRREHGAATRPTSRQQSSLRSAAPGRSVAAASRRGGAHAGRSPLAADPGGDLGAVMPPHVPVAATPRAASVAVLPGRGGDASGGAPRRRRARSIAVRLGERQADCCPICLESFEVREVVCELPCRHRFHKCCVRRYFSTVAQPTCPYCRADCSDVIL